MAYHGERWRELVNSIDTQGLLRNKPVIQSAQGPRVTVDGRELINFASNDYLGLANNPEIAQACAETSSLRGSGSGASAMVAGYSDIHLALEQELAEFINRDKALLFSTGYMANLAAVSSLCIGKTLILQDKLNHASLIDGARMSGARSQRYLHNDPESLRQHLERLSNKDEFDSVLVVTDGVFSMDGDCARLSELSDVCDQYNALLIVDDAHGLGVLGDEGRGTLSEQGISQEQCPVLIGTFGKAFGGFGAFISGPEELMQFLEQTARSHIYTTALPPATIAGVRRSLDVVRKGDDLREKLNQRIQQFRDCASSHGFHLLPSTSPIQGLIVGDNQKVIALAGFLREDGFLVGAIRPPTVPPNSARLRITLTAAHSEEDVAKLAGSLRNAKRLGML